MADERERLLLIAKAKRTRALKSKSAVADAPVSDSNEENVAPAASAPISFTEQRFPTATKGINQAKSGNSVAGGINLGNQAIEEGFRPLKELSEFLRNNKAINPDVFPAGRASDNIIMAIPRIGEALWSGGKRAVNATGIPDVLDKSVDAYIISRGGVPPTDKSTSEVAEALDPIGNIVAMGLVGSSLPTAKSIAKGGVKSAREYLYKRGADDIKESTRGLPAPTDASPTLKARDRMVETSAKYKLNQKGLDKLVSDKKKVLDNQYNTLKNAIKKGEVVDLTDIMNDLSKDANNNKIGINGEEIRNAANDIRAKMEEAVNEYKDPVTGKYVVPIEQVHKIKSDLQDVANRIYGKDYSTLKELAQARARGISSDLITKINEKAPGYQKFGREESKLIAYQPVLAKNIYELESAGKSKGGLNDPTAHQYNWMNQLARVALGPKERLLNDPSQHAVGRFLMRKGQKPTSLDNGGSVRSMLPPLEGIDPSRAQGPVPPDVIAPTEPVKPIETNNSVVEPKPIIQEKAIDATELPVKPEEVVTKLDPAEQVKIGVRESSPSTEPPSAFVRSDLEVSQNVLQPSQKTKMISEITNAGVDPSGLSDIMLIEKYRELGLDKPAPVIEGPAADISVRGPNNEAQIKKFEEQGLIKPEESSPIVEPQVSPSVAPESVPASSANVPIEQRIIDIAQQIKPLSKKIMDGTATPEEIKTAFDLRNQLRDLQVEEMRPGYEELKFRKKSEDIKNAIDYKPSPEEAARRKQIQAAIDKGKK